MIVYHFIRRIFNNQNYSIYALCGTLSIWENTSMVHWIFLHNSMDREAASPWHSEFFMAAGRAGGREPFWQVRVVLIATSSSDDRRLWSWPQVAVMALWGQRVRPWGFRMLPSRSVLLSWLIFYFYFIFLYYNISLRKINT